MPLKVKFSYAIFNTGDLAMQEKYERERAEILAMKQRRKEILEDIWSGKAKASEFLEEHAKMDARISQLTSTIHKMAQEELRRKRQISSFESMLRMESDSIWDAAEEPDPSAQEGWEPPESKL